MNNNQDKDFDKDLETNLKRITIRVFVEDYEKLRDVSRVHGIGLNKIIRQVIQAYTNQLRDRERKSLDKVAVRPVRPSASPESSTQENTNV